MNKIITFMFGVAVGSVGTYFAVRQAIQAKADEEIESVVTTFHDRFEKLSNILTKEQKEELGIFSPSEEMKKDIDEKANKVKEAYKKQMEDLGYSVGVDLSEDQDQSAESTVVVDNGKVSTAPYIITEEEFGEFGNEEMTLFLYQDHVLADEQDEIIDDPESILGNCLDDFEDYDEVMYVRNENTQTDYVIMKSEKLFKDLIPEGDN